MNCFKCNIEIEISNFGDSYFYSKCETCKIVYWVSCYTEKLEYIKFEDFNFKCALLEKTIIVIDNNSDYIELYIECKDDISFYQICQKYIDNLIFI